MLQTLPTVCYLLFQFSPYITCVNRYWKGVRNVVTASLDTAQRSVNDRFWPKRSLAGFQISKPYPTGRFSTSDTLTPTPISHLDKLYLLWRICTQIRARCESGRPRKILKSFSRSIFNSETNFTHSSMAFILVILLVSDNSHSVRRLLRW